MKKLLAYSGIVASILTIAFGGAGLAMSVTPPVPVDNSFIPVEGEPGDWW